MRCNEVDDVCEAGCCTKKGIGALSDRGGGGGGGGTPKIGLDGASNNPIIPKVLLVFVLVSSFIAELLPTVAPRPELSGLRDMPVRALAIACVLVQEEYGTSAERTE